jgi:hypothetical protein
MRSLPRITICTPSAPSTKAPMAMRSTALSQFAEGQEGWALPPGCKLVFSQRAFHTARHLAVFTSRSSAAATPSPLAWDTQAQHPPTLTSPITFTSEGRRSCEDGGGPR